MCKKLFNVKMCSRINKPTVIWQDLLFSMYFWRPLLISYAKGIVFSLTLTCINCTQCINCAWILPALPEPRMPNEAFFPLKSRTFGLAQTNSGAFGIFSAELSATILVQWVPCPCFPLLNIMSTKTKPLYPHPKYLFGIGIWIWAAKNYGFSLRVSVVRGHSCFKA